jgi:hypothetical protein
MLLLLHAAAAAAAAAAVLVALAVVSLVRAMVLHVLRTCVLDSMRDAAACLQRAHGPENIVTLQRAVRAAETRL